jgi:multicomponent Na+:H+ antiporter subunit E
MILALLLFWFILSGQMEISFIIFALISIIVILLIDKKLFSAYPLIPSIKLKWIIFIAQLFKGMILSTLSVTKLIWLKPKSISPCCEWIHCTSKNHTIQMIYANAITLAPGTMSMELKDNKILVHALTAQMMEELHQATLEKQILKLEYKK